jgi:aldehyde oxidoreductase
MIAATADLLARVDAPGEAQILDALGGVLCRCTGYRKIIEAVQACAADVALPPTPAAGAALGSRAAKVDGDRPRERHRALRRRRHPGRRAVESA